MKKLEFITLKENLIEKVGESLLVSKNISSNLVVFPNQRPGYFLNSYLAKKSTKTLKSPLIFSIDNFIDWGFSSLFSENFIDATLPDLISIVYKDLEEHSRLVTLIEKENYTLGNFIGWANKIISDFEELKINFISPERLKKFDFIIGEEQKLLEKFKKKTIAFSEFYEMFYEKCLEKKLYTRAMKYSYVAENIEKLSFNFENIIFAGFFELTESEKKIFKHIYKLENSRFFYIYSPLLKDRIPFENISFPDFDKSEYQEDTQLHFYRALSEHEEVFILKNLIEKEGKNTNEKISLDEKSVIISPDSSMIMPCLEYVLCDIEKFNISAGYPLKMTPIYSMLKSLFNLLKTFREDRYEISAYFNFISHPYIKNLKILGRAYEFRKIIQFLRREILRKSGKKYYLLAEIEEISREISFVNENIVKKFENIENIADFCDKLISLINYVSENSTAKLHPYWGYFPQILISQITEIKNSEISKIKLKNFSEYADFFEGYINSQTYPFRGSPVEGLQFLGFLESRNLKFENVFFLDVVNGILPNLKKEDTILPHNIRKELGISTYEKTRDISLYYFENIVYSAKNAHILYIEDKTKEPSPFIEKIKWEKEKEGKKISEKAYSLEVDFSHSQPQAILKNEKIIKILKEMEYSYSAIDEYLNCQLKFYYSYVLRFKAIDELTAEHEKKDIGIIIHKILKEYFNPDEYKKSSLKVEKEKIEKIAQKILKEELGEVISLSEYLIKEQILKRVKDFIDFIFEIELIPLSCEDTYRIIYDTPYGKFKLKSTMDLIAKREGKHHIFDYKTSSESKDFLPSSKIEQIDLNDSILNWGRKVKSLQLPIYVYVYSKSQNIALENINASILTLGKKQIEESFLFDEKKTIDFSTYLDILSAVFKDIISSKNFLPPIDEKPCEFCQYKTICGRQWVR